MRLEAGPGLVLQQLEEKDASELFELINASRDRLGEWLGWVDYTTSVADSLHFIHSLGEPAIFGRGLVFGLRERGVLAGTVGFHAGDAQNRTAEVGYWLGDGFEGRGLVCRGVRACLDYGFDRAGLNRIVIKCQPGNYRSRAVAERLGFTREGLEREGLRLGDRFHDLYIYSLLRRERHCS